MSYSACQIGPSASYWFHFWNGILCMVIKQGLAVLFCVPTVSHSFQ
jgi:hypothetical protein